MQKQIGEKLTYVSLVATEQNIEQPLCCNILNHALEFFGFCLQELGCEFTFSEYVSLTARLRVIVTKREDLITLTEGQIQKIVIEFLDKLKTEILTTTVNYEINIEGLVGLVEVKIPIFKDRIILN